MSLIAQAVAAGVLAIVSAYMLFKLVENNRLKEKENDGVNDHNGLQIMFFFMVVASLILLGRVGFEAGNHCEYLLANETIVANVTEYAHEYTCTPRGAVNAGWLYRLPLYLAYLSGAYLIIYFLMLLYGFWKKTMGGRGRDDER